MKTISKVLPVNGAINILHMFTLHQCRVFHFLLSNFSSDWVSVLSHKICDEFSPRRILQNIFGSATCLSLLVCESVCPCDSPFRTVVAMNCNHSSAGQQMRCDVAQHFAIFRFMREVPLSFVVCPFRCCCCCHLASCSTT